jgi:peptidoglycan/LPS O-acetylase OafA/YrhL
MGLKITVFPESWYLAIEEWFYLPFPGVLFAGIPPPLVSK